METVVIPTLRCGLGNQLFQFAQTLDYAKKYNKKLVLCKKNIQNSPHSIINYIDIFFKDIDIIDKEPNNVYSIYEPNALFTKYIDFPEIKNNIIFCGYFQSFKYFEDIKNILFTRYSCPNLNIITEKYDFIDKSVFIQVRRKDYVSSNYDLNLHNKYFEHCIKLFNNMYNDLYFLILSDDIEWCKKQLIFQNNNIIFVEENEIISLWIMQLCKYGGICSNSTFAWWGGWLNTNYNTHSIVYFPNKIFKNNLLDLSDFIYKKFSIIDIDNI